MPPKRKNKSKEEIRDDLRRIEKTKRQIILAKLLFPFMQDMKSIYDAQTALSATSGYIQAELEKKLSSFTVKELDINFKDEPDSDIKKVMIAFLGQLEPENAKDVVDLLESYSKTLGIYGQEQFLKNPMSMLKISDIIKE